MRLGRLRFPYAIYLRILSEHPFWFWGYVQNSPGKTRSPVCLLILQRPDFRELRVDKARYQVLRVNHVELKFPLWAKRCMCRWGPRALARGGYFSFSSAWLQCSASRNGAVIIARFGSLPFTSTNSKSEPRREKAETGRGDGRGGTIVPHAERANIIGLK